MPPLIQRIVSLLDPLTEFYSEQGRTLPMVVEMQASEIPLPYCKLLVHNRDMTSMLESFYGDSLHLRVLNKYERGDLLNRQVVLQSDASCHPVEFGAIQIYLAHFEPIAREKIVACHRPLGTILIHHKVKFLSQPTAYFSIESDEITQVAFSLTTETTLYGRHNVLTGAGGNVLADVVEILAPCK